MPFCELQGAWASLPPGHFPPQYKGPLSQASSMQASHFPGISIFPKVSAPVQASFNIIFSFNIILVQSSWACMLVFLALMQPAVTMKQTQAPCS